MIINDHMRMPCGAPGWSVIVLDEFGAEIDRVLEVDTETRTVKRHATAGGHSTYRTESMVFTTRCRCGVDHGAGE